MKTRLFLIFIFLLVIGQQASAQCNAPTSAIITTTTSTCINNGSISINNITGGSLGELLEFAITTSSNPNQPLVSYQSDSTFYNIYPGTYTVSVRYNCGGSSYSTPFTATAVISGNYQFITMNFSNIQTAYCNNGGFTVNAGNGYTALSSHYTYPLVSAQNAVQPDPNAPGSVQSSHIFSGLPAGTYYVRTFDDCGNFITASVVVPQGTVPTTFFYPGAWQQAIYDSFMTCSQHKYEFHLLNFDYGASIGYQYPIKIIYNLPGGAGDTVSLATVSTLWSYAGTNPNVDITGYIQTGQLSAYSQTMIDACGNVRNSDSFLVDTSRIYAFQGSFAAACGSYAQYNNYVFSPWGYYGNQSQDSFISAGYYKAHTYIENFPFDFSTDGGSTWQSSNDSLTIPYDVYDTVQFRVCGQVYYMPEYFASRPFAPILEENPNAAHCSGNSGIELYQNGTLGMGYIDSIRFSFSSVPAGQSPLPVVNWMGYPYGSAGYQSYFSNLLPGTYMYTATNECGLTYTDSVTLSPRTYSISVTPTLSCNDQNSIQITFNGVGLSGAYMSDIADSANYAIVGDYWAGFYGGSRTISPLSSGTYIVRVFPIPPSIYDTILCPVADTVVIAGENVLSINASLFFTCGGTSATIVTIPSGGIAPYTYELYHGAVTPANLITTQTSSIFSGLSSGQSYTVRAIDNCGTGVTVSKSFAPYSAAIHISGSGCAGTPYTMTLDTVAGAGYSWAKDGAPLTDTTATYSIASLSANDYGSYTATISIPGCNSFSATKAVSASGCIVLPLELLSFDANEQGGTVQLDWATASEKNINSFKVQYSTDGYTWSNIASLPAAGGPADGHKYNFIHKTPITGANYYRLQMVANDGSYALSGIRNVFFTGGQAHIMLQPNPVSETLFVQSSEVIVSLEVFASEGTLVLQYTNLPSQAGIKVHALPAGVYFVKVTDVAGNTSTQRIVKW